jgi:hypothetical protein
MRFDEDTVAWHFAVWEWLLENFGGYTAFLETRLTTPTHDHFPFAPSYDHSYFVEVFTEVKSLMGLEDWPCKLEKMDDEDTTGDLLREHGVEGDWESEGAAGTFQISDEEVIIRYSPRQAEDPASLVATLAHELSHYLLATAISDPPGGWDDHELHTDVAAVFSGFGIFQCNSSFSFNQWSDGLNSGWSSQRQGYLPESELAYSLAIFATLSSIETKPIISMLHSNSRSYFKRALKDLKRRSDAVEHLKSVTQIENKANKTLHSTYE